MARSGKKITKGASKNFYGDILSVVIVSHMYTYIKTYQLFTLNMYSVLNVNYTSAKLLFYKAQTLMQYNYIDHKTTTVLFKFNSVFFADGIVL